MRPAPTLLAALVLGGSQPAYAQSHEATPVASNYHVVVDGLLGLSPRGDAVAPVHGFTFTRDAATFTLRDGTIWLLSTVAGRAVGAVFVGHGQLDLVPPTWVEREVVRQAFDADSVHYEFTSLVLLFADTTADELTRQLEFGVSTVPTTNASRHVSDALEYLGDRKHRRVSPYVLVPLLNGWRTELFYAHMTGDDEPLFFLVDPTHRYERVSLAVRDRDADEKSTEDITRFPSVSERASGTQAEHRVVAIDRYVIESEIADNLDYVGRAEIQFHAVRPDLRWVPFQLFEDLAIDSVRSVEGEPLAFERPEQSEDLWIQLPTTPPTDSVRTITLYYRGELMERQSMLPRDVAVELTTGRSLDRWIFLKDPNTWYPQHAYQPAPVELTFHIPRNYTVVSVGDSVDGTRRGDRLMSRWVSDRPIRASFNIGEFERFDVHDDRIPPVTVLLNTRAHTELRSFLAAHNVHLFEQKNMAEQVGVDIANSFVFFQERFGTPIPTRFAATEIPYSHGQAFSGLLHLSWATFQWTDKEGTDELFRAHEMAHQWWGVGVQPRSYRDQWLSEGMSQFAGLWYVQFALQDNEKYFALLREWRDELLDRRNDTGPISLGYRTGLGEEPSDFQLVVYRKAAWVLHMLRNLMLDIRTFNEDVFNGMLADFYATNAGGAASTAQFRRTVEQHSGLPMDWFFDQWIHGRAIPTYHVSHAVTTLPDTAGYRLQIRVRQTDVPPTFKMYMPVLLDFDEQGEALVRLFVQGPESSFTLDLSSEPVTVTFNALESVLAEVKHEAWAREP